MPKLTALFNTRALNIRVMAAFGEQPVKVESRVIPPREKSSGVKWSLRAEIQGCRH
jgi:hypothetical protein